MFAINFDAFSVFVGICIPIVIYIIYDYVKIRAKQKSEKQKKDEK